MDRDAPTAGRRRLLTGLVVGLALVGALVALQVSDDTGTRDRGPVTSAPGR